MDSDRAFLDAILAAPDDPAVRLVYADWLDEHGQPERAEFMRTEAALSALSEKDRRRAGLLKRLRELQPTVGVEWSAGIDRTKIEGCDADDPDYRRELVNEIAFADPCPLRWEKLTPTDDPLVRHCENCLQQVYFCSSVKIARKHAKLGHCVAVDSSLVRKRNDVTFRSRYRMGRFKLPVQYRVGDPVAVRKGEFTGIEGIVRRVSLSRFEATVEIATGDQTQLVDIAWDILRHRF
jgi:uncharacterized protein (TIGR02996 family)